MNTKQFHRRVWAIVLLLALMITGMGATLYDLQINNGEAYYQRTGTARCWCPTGSSMRSPWT